MGLTRTAITRPVFILMLMVAAILLGTLSYRAMRVELNPDVSFGVVTVNTTYPGAGPDEINTLISRRIEEAVSGVNGVREVTSTSQEGVSSVVVTLELGFNVDTALNDVRSKIDGIANSLPKDANKPTVSKFDNSAQPVEYLAFSSTKLSSRDLRDLIDQKIGDRFAQIPGVVQAAVQGGDIREVQVQVSRDKLLAYRIGITDVQKAVANANLNVPAGKLESGPQEYTVRVLNQFSTADQIRQMIFTVSDPKNPQGKPTSVHLSDVANVVDTAKERTSYSRLNGADTIVMALSKAKDGNAVQISAAADALIIQLQKEYTDSGVHIEKTFQQATQISDSLADVQFALFFGIFLVSAIVYIFLHNLRGMVIVAIAIPTSILCTFIAMNLFGFTINNMTMLSLSLAIGVLVDDAIVVLENIYRHLRLGEKPRDAALNGRMEIGLAALAITMADVVVFLPIAFMGGITGQFFKPLAVGFVCATLFSLFVSFTVTPLLASRWYKEGEDVEHPTGGFSRWFERGFVKLERGYGRALEWALTHRWFVFVAGNVILFGVFMFIGGSFAPSVSAAVQSTIRMIGMAIVIGISVFGINYWKNVLPAKTKRTGSLFLMGAIFLMTAPLWFKMFPNGIVLGLLIALVAPWPPLGVAAIIAQLVYKRGARLRVIANAALFALVFPLAAIIGFSFAQWKKEQVFKFEFLPNSDSGQIQANIQLPPGANLNTTQKIVSYVENKLKADPDVKYVLANVGTQGVGSFAGSLTGSNYAQVQGTLYDQAAFTDKFKSHTEHLRTRTSDSVAADVLESVGRVPGAQITVSAASSFGFGSAIQLSFTSENREHLNETAQKVRNLLAAGAIKGVINPDVSSKPGKPELQIHPDPASLADSGTNVDDLGKAARTLYQGNNDSKLRVNGNEYDINVMMSRTDRDNPNLIGTVPIKFSNGNPIFLSQIGTVDTKPGVNRIDRRNRAEEVRVTADLLPGNANGTVQAQIDTWLKAQNLVPADVKYKPLGQADAQARESGFLFGALGIGFVLVYMLLASLYDNVLYPFIIQMAQPQAMVGAILGLIIMNRSLNLVGFIGIVALIGLVGKNAILLVDYTNTLRGRNRNRHDALVEAGPTRLRPILMTTSALILAMIPVAAAIGRGSEFRETIGITIIGGITLSTMLTLLVIPCSYTIFDDASIWIGRLMGRQSQDPQSDPLLEGTAESDAPAPAVEV